VIVTLSSGNLSITQNALNMLEERARRRQLAQPDERRVDVRRRAADRRLAPRGEEPRRPVPDAEQHRSSASFLVGGQIRGEPPRLFNVYSEGNFIEATPTRATSRAARRSTASRSSTA
jgi:putative proteasome-type protease